MRIIAILVLVFGIGLAGSAIYVAYTYFEQYEAALAEKNKGPEATRIVVAKTPLRYGTKIDAEKHLKWVDWPKGSLPPGSFQDLKKLLGEKYDETRVVLRSIEPNEPILETKITGFGEDPRMAMQLEEGKRAVSIRIDSVSGVSGFIAPGDRVDILLIRRENNSLQSSVILQDIRVIAIDQRSSEEADSPRVGRTATVEVSALEAQKIHLAQQLGRLSLTLRSVQDFAEDVDQTAVESVDVRDLLGKPRKKKKRPGTSVRVRRGGEIKDQVTFQD